MFYISDILNNESIEIHYREDLGECFKISINKTQKGFSLIKDDEQLEDMYGKDVELSELADIFV